LFASYFEWQMLKYTGLCAYKTTNIFNLAKVIHLAGNLYAANGNVRSIFSRCSDIADFLG